MSFSLDVAKFAEKAGNNASLVVKKVATDISSRIVFRTPVDEGRARGNWFVTFGSPSSEVSSREDKSGLSTQAPLPAMVSAFESLNGKTIYSWKSGDIWISNNLPYIQRLETGWSKQSPAGMVRVTVREFQGYVRKAVGELKK